MARKIYTVSKEALIAAADAIERDANAALSAWILLGQSDKYGEEMAAVRVLRSAATYKNLGVRRTILRDAGFEISKV